MRFLILTQYYAPEIGAAQVRLGAVARTLLELGHEVEVVTALPNYPGGKIFPQYRGRFYCREKIDGVEVHRVWVHAAKGASKQRLLNYLTFGLACLFALSKTQRPDFILVESPPLLLSIPGFWATKLYKSKMIFNVADLWPEELIELGLIKDKMMIKILSQLEKWSYDVSYKINAVTDGIKIRLVEKGIVESKVLLLPNGADIAMFRPRTPDVQLGNGLGVADKKIILYAGGMGYMHNLEYVLDAAKLLLNRRDILFLFIGEGPKKAKLQGKAEMNSLENVLFLEPAPPEFVARLYSLAAIGLVSVKQLPSFNGVRSAKMLPAMASGVPLIYCGVGEGPQLVEKAKAGLVVEPGNPEALSAAVIRLVDDPKLAQDLGRNGRKFVEENLSWAKLVETWLEELLQERSGQHG